MSHLTDPEFLRSNQYRDSRNLSARAGLHQRFSTNKKGWHRWVFENLSFPTHPRVLEIGSGPAYLWKENIHDLPSDWQVFLGDISQGMLEEARSSLSGLSSFSYITLDTIRLPFPTCFFDAVISNHVLYHVPAVREALGEIQRVIKPGGCLYAATNGKSHLKEIRDWKEKFMPAVDPVEWGTPTARFSLENGRGQLHQFFHPIELMTYPDHLEINEVEPVLAYIQSYLHYQHNQQMLDQLRRYLEGLIHQKGAIKVSKESGMFLAFKR